jgi:hypothetical protein
MIGALPLAFVLGACASWVNLTWADSQTQEPAPVVDATPSLNTLIVRMAGMRQLTSAELRVEVNRVERSFADWGTVASRIELAWLLSRPNTGFQDNRRSVKLLREYLNQPDANADFQAFAGMLHDLIFERAIQRAASSRAKEELAQQRRQAEALQEQIDTLLQVLATLQGQVNALRDIEKSISGRQTADETDTVQSDDSGESNTPGG